MHHPSPGRHSSNARALRVNDVPIHWPAASIDIDILGLHPETTFPEPADGEECHHDWESEVGFEETFCRSDCADCADRGERCVELWDLLALMLRVDGG